MKESPFSLPRASSPGETISDLLASRRLSIDQFAKRACLARQDVKGLLEGRTPIDPPLAQSLESVFDVSAAFWLCRESRYRALLKDLADTMTAEAQKAWIRSLPIRDMISLGWIQELPKNIEAATAHCLQFFGEPDIAAWKSTFLPIVTNTAFRSSETFGNQTGAVSAWLRRGEIEALEAKCDPWNPKLFREALELIRPLTRKKSPQDFLPHLKSLCAKVGVAVVVVRAPAGCRASGATRFVTAQKALLMLSFRYLSDDHFWFTFFHEAAHLLIHTNDDLFLEGENDGEGAKELEANQFAAQALVPKLYAEEMAELRANSHSIIRFARKVGVSPGIIVGQLQHAGHFEHRQMNHLKRRFKWGS